MPKCLYPVNGISIHTDGRVAPCCSWREQDRSNVHFFGKDDWQSRHKIIATDLETKWLPECVECKAGEDTGGYSLRRDSLELFDENSVGIEYWDFKLNTTCNLACKMCGAHSSSAWIRDVKNNLELQDTIWSAGINKQRAWKEEDGLRIEDLYPQLIDAKIIKFTGGEPLLIPEVRKCVEFLVENEVASNIRLQFITNGTQDLTAWNHLFKEFKHVVLSVSAEATGELYNYIRQHSDWELVSTNLINFSKVKYDNTDLSINCLPMSMNRHGMDDLKQWCEENNIYFFKASPCVHPDFMSPTALDNPELKNKLKQHLTILDRVYKTDYKTVCGDLFDE